MPAQSSLLAFELPSELEAAEPPEIRGLRRDQVRLLVYERQSSKVTHTHFNQLPNFLRAGDVVVLNNSRTLPASLRGSCDDRPIEIRLLHARNSFWQCAIFPSEAIRPGAEILFREELCARVLHYCPLKGIWTLRVTGERTKLYEALYRLGRPIQYEHLKSPWNLDSFQTIYATHPGSAEMPSAGRAFSWELLFRLKRQGVQIVYVTLHCGLSFIDDRAVGPWEEEYHVSPEAARAINGAKARGGRIVAVGTTVVRTLESVADATGRIKSEHSWTKLQIQPGYRLKIVDGLLTGFHEPRSSHLELLTAFVGNESLRAIYEEALRMRYHWHEFGDTNLIL